MTVLDIGHGLAVVIEQNNLALLYDTGNAWKGIAMHSVKLFLSLNITI